MALGRRSGAFVALSARGLERWFSAAAASTGPTHTVHKQHRDACCRRVVKLEEPYTTGFGETIPEISVTVEQWGDPSLPASRTIVLFPSFSHSSHARSNVDDPSPGWWETTVGPGKYIDTNHWRVVCPSALGSPFGSTSPLTVNPTTGKRYQIDFPQITPADMAKVHALVLEKIGLKHRLHGLIGASLGGMQALQFASLFPDRVSRLAVLSATGQTTPGSNAMRYLQRRAIMLDPKWGGGRYELGEGPINGMEVAREFGLVTYRSNEEFNARFDWTHDRSGYALRTSGMRLTLSASHSSIPHSRMASSEMETYLNYNSKGFARRYDANCYLLLSKCADLMKLGEDRMSFGDAVRQIKASCLFVGVKQDTITPAAELASMAKILAEEGKECRIEVLDSIYGHDLFLKDMADIGPMLLHHFESGLKHELQAEAALTTGLSLP